MTVEIGTVAAQLFFWEYLFLNLRYFVFAVGKAQLQTHPITYFPAIQYPSAETHIKPYNYCAANLTVACSTC